MNIKHVVHLHIGILFNHKRRKYCHLQQHGWMDFEGILLSEIIWVEKDKHRLISVMWDNKNKPHTKRD